MDENARRYEERIDRLISVLKKIASEFYGPLSATHAARLAINEDKKLASQRSEDSGMD